MWTIWVLVGASWASDFAVFHDDAAWRTLTTRTDRGVTVEVQHRMHGDVNCFRGITRVVADPDLMLATSMDVPNAPRWSYTPLPISTILAREPGAMTYHQMVDVPNWTLAADRYWVLRGEHGTDPDGTRRFRWSRVDAATAFPEIHARLTGEAGAIEVPVNWGLWRFTPADQDQTDVMYGLCTDAGGVLPTWLQRVSTRQTLPDVVINLVTEAQRRATPTEPTP